MPASGWNGFIKVVVPDTGIDDSTTKHTDTGWTPDTEGASLEMREEYVDRSTKISGYRVPDTADRTIRQELPGGDIGPIRPKVDDILPLLMGFFQCVDMEGTMLSGTFEGPGGIGGGTFTFVPIEDQPDWTGSTWGSYYNGSAYNGTITTGDVYPIGVIVSSDLDFLSGSEHDYYQYKQGIVTGLSFSQPFNEDLTFTPTLEFMTAETVSGAAANIVGTASTKSILVDWEGTVSVDGSEIEAESLELAFDNTNEGIGVLGNKGYARWQFGRGDFGGSFEHELQEDLRTFNAGTAAIIAVRWQNSTSEWMEIDMQNCKYEPNTPPLVDGASRSMRSVPFKAWANGGTPAVRVKVCTALTAGTSGFNRSIDTDWPSDAS